MAEKVFYDRFAKVRKERIEKRVGKNLIYDEDEMLAMIINRKVPTMIQHCILKVRKKVKGGARAKYLSAFNICVAVFAKYNYIKNEKGKGIVTTGKGQKRNRLHQNETDASTKASRFDADTQNLWQSEILKLKEFEKQTGKKTKIAPKAVMPITADPEKTKKTKQKKQPKAAKTGKKATAKKAKKAKKAKVRR